MATREGAPRTVRFLYVYVLFCLILNRILLKATNPSNWLVVWDAQLRGDVFHGRGADTAEHAGADVEAVTRMPRSGSRCSRPR